MVLNILITTSLTSVLFLVNLRSWRGHRVYLLSSVLGLNIMSLSSGKKYKVCFKNRKWCILPTIAVFKDSSTTNVGLHVLLGPSLANISLLRLLLLLDIVSSSKLSPLFKSPWSLFQLSLGPLWGLAKLYLSLDYPVYPTHLDKTLNGIEAFWDLGCCLLYLCLRIIIFLNSKILLKLHGSTEIGTMCSRIVKESWQRPLWRLVANDGYILSVTASLACRGSIMVLPSIYLPWVLSFVIILDMRTNFVRELSNNTKTKDTSSTCVTRVATSRTTSSIFPNYTVTDIESLQR